VHLEACNTAAAAAAATAGTAARVSHNHVNLLLFDCTDLLLLH
jgi:hypothetical protein